MRKYRDHPAFSACCLVIVFSIYYFLKLDAVPIRIWDEARLANSALDMHLNGLSLVPKYKGEPDMWSTKPPLLIWIQALFMKFCGPNEWAIRLPSAISTLLTGFTTWLFCKYYFKSHWKGFVAASVFATSFAWVYIHAGRTGDYDALLTLFITVYSFSIFLFTQLQKKWSLSLFWTALTLAVLTKGVAGMLFLPGIAIFILFSGSVKLLFTTRRFYFGLICFLLVIAGYYLTRESVNPGYLRAVWENELGGRYLTVLEEHNHPFSYYFDNMYIWRFPTWKYLVIPGFVAGFFNPSRSVRIFTAFNFTVCLSYLLIISAAKTKLEWYDLPVYVFFAVQIAVLFFFFYKITSEKIQKIRIPLRVAIFIAGFVILFYKPAEIAYKEVTAFTERPWDVEPHQQGYFIKQTLKEKISLEDYIFMYDGYSAQIEFYIIAERAKGVNIRLQDRPGNFRIGDHIVANQVGMKQIIEQNYAVTKTRELFGCTEYLVK